MLRNLNKINTLENEFYKCWVDDIMPKNVKRYIKERKIKHVSRT